MQDKNWLEAIKIAISSPFRRITVILLISIISACSKVSQVSETGSESDKEKPSATQEKRPNVLLIVVDDLGYTDLGVYGGEIPTPNIDELATNGALLTNFYAAPTCSPTRSMLLSGTDSHIAGLGNMGEMIPENQRGKPGYEGYINFRVATLAEVLEANGYSTYMTGKWHLGLTEETGPTSRGFQRSFALLEGGAGHFDNMLALFRHKDGGKAKYREDGKMLASLPKGFYSSKFYAERLIDYIETGRETGKPFFGYLAFSAPHWPLQAPQASIARHRGNYDSGYEDLFDKRNAALKATGLISQDLEPSPNLLGVPAWDDLSEEEKARQARIMEVYAAMVEDIDIYVGQVIDYLKSIGEYENTLIVFMSDNGAEGHGMEEASPPKMREYLEDCCNNAFENIGAADSYVYMGSAWARASVGPWQLFKGFMSEGGIRVPAFFHYPNAIDARVNKDVITVKDVMPTVLDVLNIEHPAPKFQGRKVAAMQGQSLLPALTGQESDVDFAQRTVGMELFGKIAVRHGDWKLLQQPQSEFFKIRTREEEYLYKWQLYNLAEDPTERNNLASSRPDVLKEMIARWEAYRKENSVVLPDITYGY